jgi:heme peroxidase
MERHASESYDVAGEGLLTVSAGGRDRPTGAAAKAAAPFQFSRMGPDGKDHQLDPETVKALAANMAAGGGTSVEESLVPAGYTYLGQFVAHDLSFDKTIVTLGTNISPTRLLQGTSPCLDLDSLYGAGPQDPESAGFYEDDGLHLKMGGTIPGVGGVADDGFDLPRGTPADRRTAVIADPRNDDNLAVAQTHLAFIRFHNRVVDTLPASVPQSLRFAQARELVTKHYQWVLRTDYLPRICAHGVVNDVFNNGRKAFEVGVPSTDVPTMPIEFSIAAFRLGHSMVRGAYNWNKVFDDGNGFLELLFTFSSTGGDLGRETRLLSTWIADFRRLYDFGEANKPNLVVPASKFNRAMRIDTSLVDPLKNLPQGTFGGPTVPFNDPRANLAFRNLERAKMVNLATGQQMARFLQNKGVTLTRLTHAQIRDGRNGAELDRLNKAQRAALLKDTPLWFYVLREAELNGGRLKGVGARIVAETFHRAMEGSQASIVNDSGWRPTLGPNSTTFRMVDLLLFAFEGKKTLLAPLG